MFAFRFLQSRRSEIAPSQLRSESIPDQEIAFVQAPAFFEAPFENFFVSSALRYTLAKIAVMNAKEIAAGTICRLHGAKILVVILVQLAARVQSNFVEHPREIHHPA